MNALPSLYSAIIFSIIFVLVFVCGIWQSPREWARSLLLDTKGQLAQAKIIERRSTHNRAASYFVTYRFNVQGLTHHPASYLKTQRVSGRHIERLGNHEMVDILYLPRNPQISKLAGTHLDNSSRNMATIWTIIAVIVLPYFPASILIWIAIFLFERFRWVLPVKS